MTEYKLSKGLLTPLDHMAEQIAEALVGQCVRSLDDELGEYGLDLATAPRSLLEDIDQRVFCCEVCGWWCSTDEESETRGVCIDDFEPEEDDDDSV